MNEFTVLGQITGCKYYDSDGIYSFKVAVENGAVEYGEHFVIPIHVSYSMGSQLEREFRDGNRWVFVRGHMECVSEGLVFIAEKIRTMEK